ncbi:hypothetical protein KKC67_00935 [Patescibacteria group bacterium]|nr:hypothetical protein [Patescibacteria group bacterium]MBU0879316.1 hypothetical protein [Patescibacteria group bacterium]MBU0880021.1 hypothetical protein [Patescibacteria group bacterium]MBU0897583.1 hypothetical protein [Patescibacteria group bacterium]MBU1783340.1 hypothetical protein [Patescibacteria group bacterium]
MENQQSVSQPVQQTVTPSSQPTATSLLGVFAILDQACGIYKKKLGVFLGIMAIAILATIGSLILLGGIGYLGYLFIYPNFVIGATVLFIFLAILFILICFISQGWSYVALLYAIKDSQEKIGIKELYRRAWSKVFSYWWVSFLVGLIIMGGFYLFAVPGIIFSVWFSLAIFVLIAEDLKGMNALLKSREYTKGRWWSIFWRFLFIIIVGFVILILFLIVGAILSSIFAIGLSFLKISFSLVIIQIILNLFTSLLSGLAQFFLTPLIMTYLFLVYKNLKDVKGEFVFTPTNGKKAIFIATGIFGILVILIVTIFVALTLKATPETYWTKPDQAELVDNQNIESLSALNIIKIQTELDNYYIGNDKYPSVLNEMPLDVSQVSIFIDPLTEQPYSYQLLDKGEDYMLCAQTKSKDLRCVTSEDLYLDTDLEKDSDLENTDL